MVSVSTSSRVKRIADSRLLAASLHRSTARNHDHQLGAEIGEDVGAGLAETIAVSEQHDHRGDAPGHAEHGERGAAAIVPHGAVSFASKSREHHVYIHFYSCRSASTGCSIAALRAG